MGLGQPYGHRRSLNNTILPCEGKNSSEVANRLRDYGVTLCGEKSENKRDWGLRPTLRVSGVGIKRLL